MHLAPLIRDLAIILAVAGLMSLLFRRIRQPVVLGYLVAGFIVGPYTPPFRLVTDLPSIQTWAELGVIFLMFSLGLEFSFRKLTRVGVSAGVTAAFKVLLFVPIGFATGRFLGWSSMDSVFLGAMLSISSTTVIIKALSEAKLKTHRFAELIYGVLVVEDLFAILILVALTTVAGPQAFSPMVLLTALLKLVLVVGGWFIAGYFVVPRFMRYVGKVGDNEILTLLSLGLCLGLVVFASHFQYSTALGAFIMGSIIAESPVLHRVEERMESLRDLFGAIFFVSIGMLIDPSVIWEYKGTIAVILVVTMFGKIITAVLGALVSGQSVKSSVRVGFGLAQIGEFSFIIAGLGLSLQVTSSFLYPVAVAISALTTFLTPYLINLSGPAGEAIEAWLPSRVTRFLYRYALWVEDRKSRGATRGDSAFVFFKWCVNGVIISIIYILVQELVESRDTLSPLLAWGIATLLSSPFIWAMVSLYQKYFVKLGSPKNLGGVRIFVSRVLTLLLIGALSTAFFPGRYVFGVGMVVLLSLLGIFYRQLEVYYQWYEHRFVAVFSEEEAKSSENRLSHLAPWDAHLVHITVHPNSKLILKRLLDAELRTRYGVNVVAIQRGDRTIVTPLPEEVLLPGDELVLLGTDEQVERTKQVIEQVQDDSLLKRDGVPELAYELRSVVLSEGSRIAGQTIRESKIRDHFQSMVVGIEREAKRTINPDSDLRLLANDTLWVVGERTKLDSLFKMLTATPVA